MDEITIVHSSSLSSNNMAMLAPYNKDFTAISHIDVIMYMGPKRSDALLTGYHHLDVCHRLNTISCTDNTTTYSCHATEATSSHQHLTYPEAEGDYQAATNSSKLWSSILRTCLSGYRLQHLPHLEGKDEHDASGSVAVAVVVGFATGFSTGILGALIACLACSLAERAIFSASPSVGVLAV
jgi:hypothetical protein